MTKVRIEITGEIEFSYDEGSLEFIKWSVKPTHQNVGGM